METINATPHVNGSNLFDTAEPTTLKNEVEKTINFLVETDKKIYGQVTEGTREAATVQNVPIEENKYHLIFTDFASIKAAISEIKKEECTFERFVSLREYFFSHEVETKYIIEKLTIKQIHEFIYVMRSGEKKADLVNSVYDAIVGSFDIGEGMLSYTWSFGDNKTINRKQIAQRKRFDEQTEEIYLAWKAERKAKAAAFLKAMTNPETLEEFTTFVRRKGEAALTTEQREIYDELRTGITKEQKQRDADRKAQVTAVQMEDTEMIIIPSRHTKKDIPLWVVKLSERVEKYIFRDLNDRAKQLGGYYSSYRGGGAIPGFTFEREEAAKLFIQIKDGDVNAKELREAINADKQQQSAENLQDKAESINTAATEELNRDRQDNTARRARMASSAEQQAAANIVFSITLNKIAEGIQNGTVKHLEKLSTIVQLEELERILSRCKWSYIHAKDMRENDFTFTPEVIDYAIFPYPILYKEHIMSMLQKLSQDKGKKLAAVRIWKRLNGLKADQEFLTVTENYMEDFKNVFMWQSPGIDRYECERYKNAHLRYQRITRLGITTIYELRAALRELVRIKEGVQLTPEQLKMQQIRELERKFVGRKIDGFFPTPETLAKECVIKAGIEAGNRILEPSAGLGHIAEIIRDMYPDNHLCCIEYNSALAEALQLKGFDNTLNMDFLSIDGANPDTLFDKIIMNPPFENLADIDHVNNAWKLLNPGGRIVAIMANNKTRDNKKVSMFMQQVEEFGTWEPNPSGSFMSAFRPTGVNTITVILDKPF